MKARSPQAFFAFIDQVVTTPKTVKWPLDKLLFSLHSPHSGAVPLSILVPMISWPDESTHQHCLP